MNHMLREQCTRTSCPWHPWAQGSHASVRHRGCVIFWLVILVEPNTRVDWWAGGALRLPLCFPPDIFAIAIDGLYNQNQALKGKYWIQIMLDIQLKSYNNKHSAGFEANEPNASQLCGCNRRKQKRQKWTNFANSTTVEIDDYEHLPPAAMQIISYGGW